MLETSARLLALLGLLQARDGGPAPSWPTRLAVTGRTVRNDIDRLRELGYPVDATAGRAGSYRLGVGAKLPPLLLDDEEAVAMAVGLHAASGDQRHRGDPGPGADQAGAGAAAPAAPPGRPRCARR